MAGAPKSDPKRFAGEITHYFAKVRAAVIKLRNPLAVGDRILVVGPSTRFKQAVKSLQINHIPIDEGRKGEEVGLQVLKDVKVGDKVFLAE